MIGDGLKLGLDVGPLCCCGATFELDKTYEVKAIAQRHQDHADSGLQFPRYSILALARLKAYG